MNKKKLKYYCKDCSRIIEWHSGLYGSGKCKSCINKGKKHSLETIEKIKNSYYHTHLKGKDNPFYGKKHTKKTKVKSNLSHGGNGILYEKKGISNLIRESENSKKWIKDIFVKDNYKCQECFIRGGKLEAHHIKAFSLILQEFLNTYSQFSPLEDKETLLRLSESYKPFWDLFNGRTLCVKCHNKTKGIKNVK